MPEASASQITDPATGLSPWLPDVPGWTYGSVLPLARGPGGQLAPAVPELLRTPLNDLGLALQGPRAALLGQLSPDQAAALAPRAAMGLLGAGVGAPAEAGALRVFGGVMAKTADRAALAKAIGAEAKGAGAKEIWQNTGWFRDVDDKWKFEISDTGATLGPGMEQAAFPLSTTRPWTAVPKTGLPLSSVLTHPGGAFEAYPELASASVSQMPLGLELGGTRGAVTPAGAMLLSGGAPERVLSTSLHELQHLIQDREGFASGGSSEQFLPEGFSEQWDKANEALEDTKNKLRNQGINPFAVEDAVDRTNRGLPLDPVHEKALGQVLQHPELASEFNSAMKAIGPLQELKTAAYVQYRNLAGEVEARNVQQRHAGGLGPETFPHATPGYPTGARQIVQIGGKTVIAEPVEHNPFALSAVPIDHNPFTHSLQPVEHDPFEGE